MKQAFVFIYAKDDKIKALSIENAKRLNDSLITDGWVHTQTLDACVWIEYLYNESGNIDLFDEVKSLAKVG